jgi:hypothetical protein
VLGFVRSWACSGRQLSFFRLVLSLKAAFKHCLGKSRVDFDLGVIYPHYLGDTILQTLAYSPHIMRAFHSAGGNVN